MLFRSLPTEKERQEELKSLARWENPEPGSFYDEVGHIGRSPHVVREFDIKSDPQMDRFPNPGYWWWDEGKSRKRLSWQTSMTWPTLKYSGLDTRAKYTVRMTGYGDAKPRFNGDTASSTVYGKGIGEFKEFPVRPELLKDGKLVITFDKLDEQHLNWRQQSRVSEVWLLRH